MSTGSAKSGSPPSGEASVSTHHVTDDDGSQISHLADTLQRQLIISDQNKQASGDNCANSDNFCRTVQRTAGAEMQSLGDGSNGPNVVQNHVVEQPARSRDTMPHNRVVVGCMKFVSTLLILFYFIIPAFVKIYPAIIVDVAFLNHLRWPPFLNLSEPSECGLNSTHTFFVESDNVIRLGAWHMLPEELSQNSHSFPGEHYTNMLKAGPPIVLYLHGNTGTRAGWHRVQLYKVLSKAGFHVVTFDYRGYGDSSGAPSEDGLVHDALSVFRWIKQHSESVPVYIWGHSLGSGVATKTAARLCHEGEDFKGLILESPFNNFIEAASNHPFSLPFRVMPWFTWVFIESIKLNNIRFASDENIGSVTVPVLILHALDDGIVPYELGLKLYDAALRRPAGSKVKFVTFDGDHGYGHKHIHKSPDLVPAIRKFTSERV